MSPVVRFRLLKFLATSNPPIRTKQPIGRVRYRYRLRRNPRTVRCQITHRFVVQHEDEKPPSAHTSQRTNMIGAIPLSRCMTNIEYINNIVLWVTRRNIHRSVFRLRNPRGKRLVIAASLNSAMELTAPAMTLRLCASALTPCDVFVCDVFVPSCLRGCDGVRRTTRRGPCPPTRSRPAFGRPPNLLLAGRQRAWRSSTDRRRRPRRFQWLGADQNASG